VEEKLTEPFGPLALLVFDGKAAALILGKKIGIVNPTKTALVE